MDNFFEPEKKPNQLWIKLKNPWVLMGLGIFVFLAVLLFSINGIMRSILHSHQEVVVPNLEGKNLTEALQIVSDLKLSLRQENTENDDRLPAGTIVRQHPPSGMNVREGRVINVVVSMGGEAVMIPDVVGKPLVEAQSVLSQSRLQIGAVSEIFSLDVAEGLAVSQDPSSGTIVAKGAMVDILVSKGMPPAGAPLMPDFIGRTVDNVQMWAEGVNAKVKIVEDPSVPGSPGQVIRQSPLASQPVAEGDILSVTIVPLTLSDNVKRVSVQIPGEKEVSLRVVARNKHGENEVYKGIHRGGEKLEIPVQVNETTRVRIFINDVLQEER